MLAPAFTALDWAVIWVLSIAEIALVPWLWTELGKTKSPSGVVKMTNKQYAALSESEREKFLRTFIQDRGEELGKSKKVIANVQARAGYISSFCFDGPYTNEEWDAVKTKVNEALAGRF